MQNRMLRGGGQLVDWSQKEKAVARVISHLPEYAQKLLIESGVGFKFYSDDMSIAKAYKRDFKKATGRDYSAPAENISIFGFYSDMEHTVHWINEDNSATTTLLHEFAHAIDRSERKANFSDLPPFDLLILADNHLRSKNEAGYTLYNYLNGDPLTLHIRGGGYASDDVPSETVAELFAERTILQWQHADHAERADEILAEKYPEIWPTMAEQYLPFMEKKADALYTKNHAVSAAGHEVKEITPHGPLAVAANRHVT